MKSELKNPEGAELKGYFMLPQCNGDGRRIYHGIGTCGGGLMEWTKQSLVEEMMKIVFVTKPNLRMGKKYHADLKG